MPDQSTGSNTGSSAGRRGRLGLGLALVAAGAVVVALGLGLGHHDGSRPAAVAGTTVSSSPVANIGTTATPAPAPRVPGSPARLRIPALHVDARVLPVHAAQGTLVPPSDPAELGWWADGAKPGSGHGAVLVAGHTVHDGPGALNPLGTLSKGARLIVRTAAGERLRYRARTVRTFTKGAIATRAQRLFAQRGPERLVVVTCADWDGTRYLSNTVVTAVPIG